MRVFACAIALALPGCAGAVVAAAVAGNVATAAYGSYAEYAKATKPPKQIHPVPRNGRTHGVVYADDPRIEAWCDDDETRQQIPEHCEERDRKMIVAQEKQLNPPVQPATEPVTVIVAAAQAPEAEGEAAQEEVVDLDPDRPGVREKIVKAARKKGYTVDFDSGLLEVIGALRRGETNMKQLKKTIVYVKPVDVVTAFQVLDQNSVFFRDADTRTVVWLKGYAKAGGQRTWLEGADLPDMDMRYVLITGTKVYKTLVGSKQAIVVEPVF